MNGEIQDEFLQKHNLTKHSLPHEYANAFLPFEKNVIDGKEYLSFEQLMKWTNMKAVYAGAGPGGTCYKKDYQSFTVLELRQHVGLYIFHGLSPSPRIEDKFRPQSKDVVHGNDFIHDSFGPNAAKRHKHFKAFFACQDPSRPVP